MKKKIKLLSSASALLIMTPAISLIGSCSKPTITDYTSAASVIQKDAIEEFINLCPIYRPSFKTRAICDYLKQRVTELGLGDSLQEDDYRATDEQGQPLADSSGNLTFEIPATRGCENIPKIIVQGHMDMVLAQSGEYDWRQGVKPYREGDTIHSASYKTSLGADDGIGLGILLALAKNRNSYRHGPIRCLITADEEKGVSGASQVPLSFLDADYLINLDGESATDLVTSCAGASETQFEAEFALDKTASEQTQYRITISGLKGGHSGFEIGKNKINPISAMAELVEYIQNAPSGNTTRLAHIMSLYPYTVIPEEIEFVIVTELTETKIKEYCENFKAYSQFLHPIENEMTVTYEVIPKTERLSGSLTINDTTKLLEYLTLIPTSVISYIPETNEIETSCNIGGVAGADESQKEKDAFCLQQRLPKKEGSEPIMHLQFGIQGRSSNLDHLGTMPTPLTSEYTGFWKFFQNITDHVYGSGYVRKYLSSLSWVPPWPYKFTKLWDVISKAGIENKAPLTRVSVHAWAEMAYFANHKKSLQIANIGCRIDNAHQVEETLYVSTVQQLTFNLLYTFDNIPKY